MEYKGVKFKWDSVVCTISEEESLLEMKSNIGIEVNFKNRFDIMLMTIKFKDEPEVSVNEDILDEYIEDIFDVADGTCVGLVNELLKIRPWD